MSERKVLSKYYPPDFDPSAITRARGPKPTGPRVQTVRLMAPFSMKCTACGEYIYKGRKFNARKEATDEKYYAIAVWRFYIRCTRCSAEIAFKTDPKNMDYECEKGAKRNFEPWRQTQDGPPETDEERLDRLEAEAAEVDAMGQLEGKMVDAKREMAIADALDEIRTRNARNERAAKEDGGVIVASALEEEKSKELERQEKEDEELARKAFATRADAVIEQDVPLVAKEPKATRSDAETKEQDARDMPPPATVPSFKRGVKRRKDFGAALGIKKKAALV